MNRMTLLLCLGLALVGAEAVRPESEPYPEPRSLPEVIAFLGEGFGNRHPDAPAELEQFGRLVGIWHAEQEIATRSGEWVRGTPALWIWRWVLGGFAIQDLWLHTEDQLPAYLGELGRSYQLTSLRAYDASARRWNTAWAANGGGHGPGQDFGTFVAIEEDGRVVMSSDSAVGRQRVTFSGITRDSFEWRSELSNDGETWVTVMRVWARRLERPD